MGRIARTYTIVIIPEREGNRSFSLRVSRPVIIAGLVQAIVVVLVVGVMLSKTADVVRKIHAFYALRTENESLRKENAELQKVREKVGRLDSLAAYLERLALPSGMAGTGVATGASPADTAGGKLADPGFSATDTAGTPDILPLDGWITQPYSDSAATGGAPHLGIDIAATAGTPIRAPAAGTVIDVAVDADYGNMFSIQHNGGFVTRYGHCEAVLVAKGEKVPRGRIIAKVGSTGRSTAPHLHYELVKDGKNRNPIDFVKNRKR
jgi:murein DD-endopeptidase MepM/ murein hydrolase activator NlpD